MRRHRLTLPVFATLCSFAVLIGACGSDDADNTAAETSEAVANDRGDTSGNDDSGTKDPGNDDSGNDDEPTKPAGEVDCATLKTDAELVGIAIQTLPQMRTVDVVADTFVLPDLDALRAAIDKLRPYASAATTEFLDDIAAGADALELARNGNPEDAVAQIEGITGGLDGLTAWLYRQIEMGDDLRAAGCDF